MNKQIINETTINKIIDQAAKRGYDGVINKVINHGHQWGYDGEINSEIEQALIVMLQITHILKFEMDYKIQWYTKHEIRMEKELQQFRLEQNISNWKTEMEWIHENGALQYHISIQDILIQSLHTINGAYYRINDRDYTWEDEFDEIFVKMPYGREFDLAMIEFIFLPLYNSTHGTNYKL